MSDKSYPDKLANTAEADDTLDIVRELRLNLEKLRLSSSPPGAWKLEDAIEVMRTLQPIISKLMDNTSEGTLDGLPILIQSPASEIVGHLVAALEDIKSGVRAPQLHFPETVLPAGRSHGAGDILLKRSLLAAVYALDAKYKRQKVKSHKRKARLEVAAAAQEQGWLWSENQQGSPRQIDPGLLESWEKALTKKI